MYTANFVANCDYLLKYLLQEHVLIDEIQSIKLAHHIADDAVETKNIISEYPRILSQMNNVGKFSQEAMLPIMNNIRLTKRPISLNRTDLLHAHTKLEYIQRPATNFLIIAKPGIQTYNLAEQIQQQFHCVHIDCNDLVEKEIQSESRLGIWLDKNLQLDKILPIEIILWLLQRETKSNKVLYRGYVLTGFPIIPNMDLNAKKNYLTEDEVLMFQQIVDEIIDVPITNMAHELAKLEKMLFTEYPNLEEDDVELKDYLTDETEIPKGFREVPKLFHKISCDEDVRYSIKRQLFFILDLEMKPTSLIYLDCNDEDVIRKNIYFNKSSVDELERIQKSLDRYNSALDVIQEFICYFPRPNLIFCHGAYTPEKIFESCCYKIKERGGIRLVYLADDFYDTFKDDENIIETLETTLDPNGILDVLCKIKPIRQDISWFRSTFEYNCPVMMTQGKCVKGKYQHSVRFIGSIYLMSSDENKRIFLENPQFFRESFPTCRACIMGPRNSGKSTFARCLSKFFDYATIIEVNYLFEYYRKRDVIKLDYASAVEQVILEMSTQRLDAYNREKQIHVEKINDWIKTMTEYIIGFLRPIPQIKGKNNKLKRDKKAVHENDRLRNLLNEFGFETDQPVKLKKYLTLKDLFFSKLPLDLRKNVIFREPQASDIDVKKLATERMNELNKDYKLTLARKIEILVTKIRLCEKRQKILTNQEKLYGYWILDGLPPDIELFQGLQEMNCLPDIIVNMDDSVGERLAENQNTKCRREFYDTKYVVDTIMRINKEFFKDKLNKIRKPTTESPKYFEAQLVRRELDHILMQDSLQGMNDFEEENGKYRQDFERVKLFTEPFDTQLIELDIHNKSWSDAIIYGLRDYMNFFHGHVHILQDGFPKDEPGRILRGGFTAEYCPVLFVDKMLIKLGRPENAVQIKNKTCLFSTEEAMQTFVKNPLRYIDIGRPVSIPPYRLIVIGGYHASMRSDLSRVADILGTKHMSMITLINLYLNKIRSNRQFNVLTAKEMFEQLGDRIVNDIFAPLFHEGFLFGDIMYHKDHLNITIISFHCLFLENFPLTAEHLNQMIKLNYYPEQIFYFKIESEKLLKDEIKYYKKKYKNALLKEVEAFKFQNENWMTKRRLRFNELFTQLSADIIIEDDTSFTDRLKPETLNDILNVFYVEADQNYQEQKRQLYVADMVNGEMPPDKFTKLIDEMMKLSIKQKVNDFLEYRRAEFDKIKLVANDNLIPFIQIRLHPYTTREIEKSILKYVKESSARQYMFDRAYPISYEEALGYIGYGQFMFTRYFWGCPVKNVDMNYPVLMDLRATDRKQKIQPILHKEHVYFVQQENHNVEEFIDRPYRYTNPMNVCQITAPIRVAVNGPRNSGCQTLCRRISKEFQLNCFTLDDMKEYVVKNFKWTKLATDLIENGMQIIDIQQICDLVKISINFETQGWMLRNIPLNDDLLNCFMLNGLDINLVIYLEPTGLDLWSNFKNKYYNEKHKRKLEVLQHLYGMISELDKFSKHPTSFKGYNRNILKIKTFTSRWSTWNKAYREILLLLRLYNLYELRGIQLVAGSLFKLDVTDYELEYRLSSLKLYCPMCWMQNKLLVKCRYCYLDDEEAEPLYSDNMYEQNLFQFRKYFYWSCNNHLVELMVNAESYLKIYDEKLPEVLPKLIKGWEKYMPLVNDGYCPVAYAESSNTNILIGLPEYSVLYYNKVYAMSSQSYCLQFLQDPEKYKNVIIIFYNSNQLIFDEDLKNMKLDFGTITPTLITNALFECSFERPIHYNLEPDQSLEIYLGLYLKSHNSNSSNSNIEAHKKLFLKYWDECRLIQRTLYEMQVMGNPYIMQETKKKEAAAYRFSSASAFGF